MKHKILFFYVLLSLCAILISGCPKSSSLDGLVPAQGIVKLNGVPVENAAVSFLPADTSGQVRPATSTTDAKGRFSMMTLNPGDGVYPGEYNVSIQKKVYEGEMTETEQQGSSRPLITDTRTVTEYLPAQYADIKTSGLKVTIPANGDKSIPPFELTGEVDSTPKKLKDLDQHRRR